MDDQHYDERLIDTYLETGQESAFNELVRRQQDFVFRVAFAQTGDVGNAEEVAQETFLRLASGSARPQPQRPEPFRAWLCTVVSNVARGCMRRERRLKHRNEAYGSNATQGEERDAAATVDSRETRKALASALSELNRESRELIMLHYMEGISQVELGRMKGVSQSSISRKIEKGMEVLRKHLAVAGVATTAVQLPAMLQDPALLKAPPSLVQSLALLRKVPVKALSQTSTRATMAAGRFKIAAVFFGIAAAGLAVYAATYAPGTMPQAAASPMPKVAASPEPEGKARFHKRWTFDSPQDIVDLFGPTADLKLVSKEGTPGVGCLKTVQPVTILKMQVPANHLPLRVRLKQKIIEAPVNRSKEMNLAAFWTDDSYRVFGVFRNAGAIEMVVANATEWRQTDCYLSEDFIDEWLNGQRTGVIYVQLQSKRALNLLAVGSYLIDEIEVSEVSADEIPDISSYRKFVSAIPPEKYYGTYPFKDAVSPREGKSVVLEFCQIPSASESKP